MQLARHRLEQRPGVGGLLVGRDARLGQRDLAGAEPLGGAQRRLPARCRRAGSPSAPCGRPASAARRTGRARCSRCLRTCRSLRQASRTSRSALARSPRAEHRPRQRELALGRERRFVLEPRPHGGVVAMVVPQRGFDAPAQEGLRRPARIGGEEGAIALDRRAIVVAAQDDPFRELARDRIGDRGLRPASHRPACACARAR